MVVAAPGVLIADRYRIAETLGRGGVGVVWRARDERLGRDVALKEVSFPPSVPAAEQEAMRARVMREARAAAQLSHPSVTTVFDVLADAGTATAYLVMELVSAPTLEEVVRATGPLSPARAAAIGVELLAALDMAHDAGIVHRDVKPGNVMVPEVGPAKLADFGIASVAGDGSITSTGLIMGTPSYMAPEQAQGGPSGPAVDLWGLGATLYFAVEATAPFDRGQPLTTLNAVLNEAPRPAERSGALAPILDGLLVKDPSQRLDSDTLHRRLREVIAAETARARADTAAVPHPRPSPVASSAEPTRRAGLGRRTSAVVLGLLAVSSLAAVSMLAALRDAPPDAATPEATARARAETEAAAASPDSPSPSPEPTEDRSAPPPAAPRNGIQRGVVPDGWMSEDLGDTGSTIAHPADWQVASVGETALVFREPETGATLRSEWRDVPGGSPATELQERSRVVQEEAEGYDELGISAFEYGADDAALWEYTVSENGVDLHAYTLATDVGQYRYLVTLQTLEEDWEGYRGRFVRFVKSFDPARTTASG
ncbi:hypothetical protein BH20ACT7_BH20ACT7_00530 [soil metagenome]